MWYMEQMMLITPRLFLESLKERFEAIHNPGLFSSLIFRLETPWIPGVNLAFHPFNVQLGHWNWEAFLRMKALQTAREAHLGPGIQIKKLYVAYRYPQPGGTCGSHPKPRQGLLKSSENCFMLMYLNLQLPSCSLCVMLGSPFMCCSSPNWRFSDYTSDSESPLEYSHPRKYTMGLTSNH